MARAATSISGTKTSPALNLSPITDIAGTRPSFRISTGSIPSSSACWTSGVTSFFFLPRAPTRRWRCHPAMTWPFLSSKVDSAVVPCFLHSSGFPCTAHQVGSLIFCLRGLKRLTTTVLNGQKPAKAAPPRNRLGPSRSKHALPVLAKVEPGRLLVGQDAQGAHRAAVHRRPHIGVERSLGVLGVSRGVSFSTRGWMHPCLELL